MNFIKLSSGRDLPILGFGTWKCVKSRAADIVKGAIDAGYRHIDCALNYENEAEVGDGIAAKIQDGIKREDLFVTSKLWTTYMRPDMVSQGIQKTLSDLQLSYLDLYLIHWPVPLKPGDEMMPEEADGRGAVIDTDLLETYKEMEKLVDQGKVRTIGVSNFNAKQVKRIVDNCRIKPAVNQIESHPYLPQQELIDACQEVGVHVTAYSPLGSPDRPWAPPGDTGPLQDPIITEIGKHYNKSAAQVLIRFGIQRGLSVVAKTTSPERMRENLQVLDFELSPDDMIKVQTLNNGRRMVDCDEWQHCKDYPF